MHKALDFGPKPYVIEDKEPIHKSLRFWLKTWTLEESTIKFFLRPHMNKSLGPPLVPRMGLGPQLCSRVEAPYTSSEAIY